MFSSEFILNEILPHLIPTLGCIASNTLVLTTLPISLKIRQERKIGAFNPLPTVLGVLNCLAWLQFAFSSRNPYVFFSNFLGSGMNCFYLLTAYEAKDITRKQKDSMILFLAIGLLSLMSSMMITNIIIPFIYSDSSSQYYYQMQIAGYVATIAQFFFYSSPLLAFKEAFRTKNSIYFQLPLAIALAANSTLWLSYGLLIGSAFMYIPSGISLMISMVQLISCYVWPRRELVEDDEKYHQVAVDDQLTGIQSKEIEEGGLLGFLNTGKVIDKRRTRCYSMIL